MSTNKNPKYAIYSFDTVWKRICETTDIKKQIDLEEIVGVKQNTVSARKKQDIWPEEWAYRIGQKYNLLTEWILTGRGPKNLENTIDKSHFKNSILNEIDEWLSDLVSNDQDNRIWFKVEFQNKFGMFAEWKKRREEEESRSKKTPASKVA